MTMASAVKRWVGAVLLAGAAGLASGAPAHAQTTHDATKGPGGPILVVTDATEPFGGYYAEILRAEGLNAFTVTSAGAVNATVLARHQVAIVAGGASLSTAQVGALTQWVQAGGNLVAMRPAAKLAPLLGLGAHTGTLAEGYVEIDTSKPPGAGITDGSMQFHGTADRWSAPSATAVARLFADASTATASPAVTLRSVGTAGGQAAAFTYDLAESVVLTRQGNPAWDGNDTETSTPTIRSVDLFLSDGPEPDWVDFDKIAIPQADEQQRLLANLVTTMSADRMPMPRFWYLPRGEKAAVVMTGDDHGDGGTDNQFEALKAASPPGCSVVAWDCLRSTSYLFAGAQLTDAAAAAYQAQGFELASHPNIGGPCKDYESPAELQGAFATSRAGFASTWPSLAPPRTSRTHCVTWSDWASVPKTELALGVRFDTNYYYAGADYVQDRPGLFTGSGFPMRFADKNGSLIDVYQATTQLTDEWHADVNSIDYAKHIKALLGGALGPQGYYGAFTMNMHTDHSNHPGTNAIVAEAIARGVPVVSSVQMLNWLDGRNGSSFQNLSFDGYRLRFRIAPATGANGLEAMVPLRSPQGTLLGLTANGAPVSTSLRVVKGVEYAVFPAAAAEYTATYRVPPVASTPPAETPIPRGDSGVKPRKLTATRRGVVKLGVTCRRARTCRVKVKLRKSGKTLGSKTVRVRAGDKKRVKVRLRKAARKRLVRRGSLRMTAVIKGHRRRGKVTRRALVVRAHPSTQRTQ